MSIACLVAFLQVWKPRRVFRFAGELDAVIGGGRRAARCSRAWSPFIVLTALVGSWGIKPVKALLDQLTLPLPFPVIHQAVLNPATGKPVPAIFMLQLAVRDRHRHPDRGACLGGDCRHAAAHAPRGCSEPR